MQAAISRKHHLSSKPHHKALTSQVLSMCFFIAAMDACSPRAWRVSQTMRVYAGCFMMTLDRVGIVDGSVNRAENERFMMVKITACNGGWQRAKWLKKFVLWFWLSGTLLRLTWEICCNLPLRFSPATSSSCPKQSQLSKDCCANVCGSRSPPRPASAASMPAALLRLDAARTGDSSAFRRACMNS